MVCWATDGPQEYTGRTMRESHQALMITAAEWQAFLDDFQQTLDKFSVPQAAQRELRQSWTAPERISSCEEATRRLAAEDNHQYPGSQLLPDRRCPSQRQPS